MRDDDDGIRVIGYSHDDDDGIRVTSYNDGGDGIRVTGGSDTNGVQKPNGVENVATGQQTMSGETNCRLLILLIRSVKTIFLLLKSTEAGSFEMCLQKIPRFTCDSWQ